MHDNGRFLKAADGSLRGLNLFVLIMLLARPGAAGSLSVRPADEAQRQPAPDNVVFSIQAAVDKASPGDLVSIAPGKYAEDVTIAKPNIRLLGSYGGSELRGTLRIEAPGALIINLMIQDADQCVVFGPNASGCRIYFCRVMLRKSQ